MEEFQVYLELNRSRRHDFLYPLIFREYIYALAHEHGLNKSMIFFENQGYGNKFSSLIVKRLILRMDQQNRLISSAKDSNQNPVFGHNNNLYSQMIAVGFAVIVEIPFSLRLISYSQGAEALIPHPIHLEILVQALRYWVKDASSLHLLRFSLYEYCNLKSFITPKKSISIFNPRLFLFLYNSHTCEYESIFLFLRNQSSHLRSTSSGYLGEVFYNDFQNNLWYQGKSILASKDTSLLINKWKYYFVDLWQYYFYLWSQSGRVRINQLSKYSLDFLGYLSSVRLNPSVVRSQMLENSFLIDNAVKTLDTRIPIISLIGSLSKAKFCNTLGHPISKPTLYRIKYILRFSCVKTLARKHKSSEFLEEFFTETKEEHVFSLIFPRGFFAMRRVYRGRIWYLDIICINALVNHS
ncbi:hypothetical protein ES332_A09G058800v1 [Gossypium tomentosum]|uniref:Maturase K n=1 Tax=Gossypium tomentosum TaxID=34277 RepID=A0A5D2NZ13_GOSTO|nr:hypothetical protein ES332_A09G058800v1 [Gossypium tomentosum]